MIVNEVPESRLEWISVSLTPLHRGGTNHNLSCLGQKLVCMEDSGQETENQPDYWHRLSGKCSPPNSPGTCCQRTRGDRAGVQPLDWSGKTGYGGSLRDPLI